jgi:hypothetical protein
MAIDPSAYLPMVGSSAERGYEAEFVADRANQAESAGDDIHDMTVADIAAARLTRSLRMARAKPIGAKLRIGVIPARDIVPRGGANLRPRTPEQPFADEAELANDNFGRLSLLVILLLAVIGGYFFTAFRGDDRSAIEVTPPDNAAIKIAMLERLPV